MVPGSWGITAGPHVEWLSVAVTENYASPEALANGPATNDTVTGSAVSIPTRACRPVIAGERRASATREVDVRCGLPTGREMMDGTFNRRLL